MIGCATRYTYNAVCERRTPQGKHHNWMFVIIYYIICAYIGMCDNKFAEKRWGEEAFRSFGIFIRAFRLKIVPLLMKVERAFNLVYSDV